MDAIAPLAFRDHMLRFERNRITKEHRAFCSCGWSVTGTAEHVQAKAATHDLDETPHQFEAA